MNRSLAITPLIMILVGLVGCRAQSERGNLEKSVTRLEQRLKNIDTYLQTLQANNKEQQAQQVTTIQAKDTQLAKLRLDIEQQQTLISKQRAELDQERQQRQTEVDQMRKDFANQQIVERTKVTQQMEAKRVLLAAKEASEKLQQKELADVRAAMAVMERKLAGQEADSKSRQVLEDRLTTLEQRLDEASQRSSSETRKVEQLTKELNQALATIQALRVSKANDEQIKKEAANRKAASREEAISQLAKEREEIANLRTTILADLNKARSDQDRQTAVASRQLTAENEQLKNKLRALERAITATEIQNDAAASTTTIPSPPQLAPVDQVQSPLNHDGSQQQTNISSDSLPGVETLIINAQGGTVNVHIHGAGPSTKAPASKTAKGNEVLPPKSKRADAKNQKPRKQQSSQDDPKQSSTRVEKRTYST